MTETPTKSDTGLVQRGLLLLGGMTALVAVVLVIALRRPETPPPATKRQEPPIVPIAVPCAGFPATLALPSFVKLAEQMPSGPGWEIRYNAALALARRGSAKTPWAIFAEMLDEDRLRRNFRALTAKGTMSIDEAAARRTVHNALTALGQWHEKQDRATMVVPPADLQTVYEKVDQLARQGDPPVRVHADRVRKSLAR